MADIELVIKIPEEEYNRAIKRKEKFERDLTRYERLLVDGTPLPKGHGRIGDLDALKKDDEVTEWISLNAVRTGKMLKKFSELFIKKIDATPTIIEADNTCSACTHSDETDGSHCYECVKGKSKYETDKEESEE